MSAPHFAPGERRAETAGEYRVALLPPVMPKAFLPWRRVSVAKLSTVLSTLAKAGVVVRGPTDLLVDDESAPPVPRRHVLLLAETDSSGFQTTTLPLLERFALPVTACFAPSTVDSSQRERDREILKASRSLPIAIGIRGTAALEQGAEAPERVFAQLMAARRERERALGRPCEVYLFAGRRVSPGTVDLLRRCGFRILIGRTPTKDPDVLLAEGVEKVSARLRETGLPRH